MTLPPSGPGFRDPGLQPERTTLSWGRTLLSLVVADLFIWRSWALSGPELGPGPESGGRLPDSSGFDYLGLSAGTALASTAVLFICVQLRSRQLRRSNAAAPAPLLLSAAAAVVALAGSTVTALALGR
ncbi:DUF202 domain-containing protein [Arthrobacter sp. CG_A4]|uniref:DUF202 domain-containing protein n=1 Tax=Arthrobacter sp. CG_A4 TaxID=3071706 RepID=UPI002DF95950|nr:hypothetical protein [Arthrobacter sp. CG_A4]